VLLTILGVATSGVGAIGVPDVVADGFLLRLDR
jgi:hypothetical protein